MTTASVKSCLTFMLMLGMIFTFSCKKPDPAPPANTPKLSAEDANPYPFEVESLLGGNITYGKTSYTGTMGGKDVAFTVSGNDMVFQVPDLSPGTYDVKVNVDGKDYTVSLAVKDKPVVADPKAYIGDLHTQAVNNTAGVRDILTQLAPYTDTTALGNDLQKMSKYYADALATYNNLSPGDQMKVAQGLAANRVWMDDLHSSVSQLLAKFGPIKIRQSLDYEDDQQAAMQAINDQIVKVRKDIVKALLLTAATSFFGVPAAGAILGLAIIMPDVNTLMTLTGKGITATIESVLINANKRTQTLSFKNGKYVSHFININYRSLTRDDVGTDEPLIKGFIGIVDEVNGWVDKIKALVGSDKGLSAETESVSHISNPYATAIRIVSSKHLSVKNISNPKVTFKGMSDSSNFVTFMFANSDTSDQTFTFDLVYENPGITKNTTTYTGTINKADNSMLYLTGGGTKSWKVDPSGHSTSCYRLTNPACMMDNTYTFSANGTYTYNPGSVTTCDNSCADGNPSTQSFHFSDDRKQLIVGGTTYTITRLTANSLRMSAGDEYDLIPK